MSMATVVSDKQQDFKRHIQAFHIDCGRVPAALNTTILQSDQEDHLIAVVQPTTANMDDNTTIRQSPANISQVQGSVKRFHRTLTEQVRAPKSQLQQNHNRTITSKTTSYHGRYDAQRIYSPGTRYTRTVTPVTSAGGTRTTSSHREFGETPQQHTIPTSKQLPQMERPFHPATLIAQKASWALPTELFKQEQFVG